MRITPAIAMILPRLSAIAILLGVLALVAAPSIEWLPPAGQATGLLGALLAAQAAIAALSLAVVLFALERVSARRDADDRIFEEYVRRSRMWPIFLGGLGAVAITGLVLLSGELASRGIPIARGMPGLANLVLVGAAAFAASAALPAVLLERVTRLARPGAWRELRRELQEQDVRDAVRTFVARTKRLERGDLREDEDEFLAELIPDPGERSADEAIRALLDDARRAIDERRLADFQKSLATISELVEHAMVELEGADVAWGEPGAQPEWPPLRELGSNLYQFRDEVIASGNHDLVFELLRLDYALLSHGIDRRCGELFTVALSGYRENYGIARRLGDDELRRMFRDRLWDLLSALTFEVAADEAFSYLSHVIRQQGQMLSDAMHSDSSEDYEALHQGLSGLFESLRLRWRVGSWPRSETAVLYESLDRQYRVSLMGFGGRAIDLAGTGRIADARPYLDLGRRANPQAERLAGDLAQALSNEDRLGYSLWSSWEMEGATGLEVRAVQPQRYPLSFFVVRILELVTDSTPALDFRGRAQYVLEWFTNNVEGLQPYARLSPEMGLETQRELAVTVLNAAVRGDEMAEQRDIIDRDLSEVRIKGFETGVYASVFSANTIEQLFIEAGAFQYLPADSEHGPELRRSRRFVSKGFLAAGPEGARSHWAPLDGEGQGEGAEVDLVQRLCEELDRSPTTTTALESTVDFVRAIDAAVEELGSPGRAVVLLGGDAHGTATDTGMGEIDGFEPWWELADPLRGEVAHYHGHPIIDGPTDGERRFYVIDLDRWGCFVRAHVEGATDLLVEVDLISPERAEQHLAANPDLFPDEPDEASKLRKIQTFVEVGVAGRTGFRVRDASRARKIVAVPTAG